MTVPGERTGSAWPGEHPAGADARADGAGVRARLVAAAVRIGERLAADAVWSGAGCTWPITRPAPDGEAAATVQELAPGVLYEGTAGIALFLAQLHRIHPDREIARTARGALDFALHDAASLPDDSFGLYSGRVGAAYTAVRAGRLLGTPFREAAEAVLRPLAGNEHRAGMDALGGAAGAIPALLWLSHHLDPDLTLGIARRLGEHLRATANRGGDGWSWGASVAAARALCGYS
ncbi:MAG TPA: lanthionine synthetase LanC family protein, partial [Longimicrobium sp.]|nr:lanthionine synthetase LanC family protein [Longimicrobium sp.]